MLVQRAGFRFVPGWQLGAHFGHPGWNVMYGPSGVGKTRVLQAVHYALTGERGNPFGEFDVEVEQFADRSW